MRESYCQGKGKYFKRREKRGEKEKGIYFFERELKIL